ncbi:MAG: J domain-containing protein, partial [Acidobacteria bacterium]|nr:J domain-containing protein [Acidobacteriota bacterium]
MTYYEELALAATATTKEIRQAYRDLARLLHPDRQRDEKLRLVAECQMKRLNEVVAVLTDRNKRKQYDASLQTGRGGIPADRSAAIVAAAGPPEGGAQPSRFRRGVTGRWAWVFIAAAGLVSTLWYFTSATAAKPEARRPADPLAVSPLSLPPAKTLEQEAAAARSWESLRQKYRAQEQQLSKLQQELEGARAERDATLLEVA